MNNETKVLEIEKLSLSIDKQQILNNVSLDFYKNKITAIMGPSGWEKQHL